MSSASPFATLIGPPAEDQIWLAGEEVMGYVGRIACYTTLIDDLIVFAIFLAVHPPL